MPKLTAYVPEPEMELREGAPVSTAFDDVYFSRNGGVAETTHVFLDGNDFSGRVKGRSGFYVGEFGFGTGLNFLTALRAFRASGDETSVLHYMSIEKFPFRKEALTELLALQPELKPEAGELLAAYPLRIPGVHRIHLPRCVLTLYFGDIEAMLAEWCTPIDAWFLDGFAPAKNPEMWSDDILKRVGGLSAKDATFATFTAAGFVKRGLQAAGFTVRKIPGFGHKREMLVGTYNIDSCNQYNAAPGVSLSLRERLGEGGIRAKASGKHGTVERLTPSPLATLDPLPQGEGSHAAPRSGKSAIVIGAGIAGATIAHALAERGHAVTVLERGRVAHGASGNQAGVLFPQLTKEWTGSSAWYFTAYGFMLRQLKHWEFTEHASPGMLRLPRHAEEEAQLRTLNARWGIDRDIVLWLEREAASNHAGVELQTGATFFPQGTWLNPFALCRHLLQHPNIMLRENGEVRSLARKGNEWCVTLANGEDRVASSVCIASAQESAALLAGYGITLNAVGGQISHIQLPHAAQHARSILCQRGYMIPQGTTYLIGATYHREECFAVTDERHQENLTELCRMLPQWFEGEHFLGEVKSGRSSIRATTPDRMPYIGTLEEGLYVSTGHGSRGLLSAPLGAEIIASQISGESLPVTRQLAASVNPARLKR